jgi:hypothetical protein
MKRSPRGQALVEFALTFSALIVPLTFMIIFTAQLLWVWHSMVDFTRDGARYASTHCWQSGSNVLEYMRTHVPRMIDMSQFQGAVADIQVLYFQRNPESGAVEEFACEGSPCTAECVPDLVTVRIRSYEFRHFMSFLGLPPVPLPDFQMTLPMEGAGCDPDSGSCSP